MGDMRKDRTNPPAVLFLCLGNICRSPLAEGAARAAFAAAGIDATLDSAGTGDWHVGRPPDARAQAEARRRGGDIGTLCPRQLPPGDFRRFHLNLAAAQTHRARAPPPPPHAPLAGLLTVLGLWAAP